MSGFASVAVMSCGDIVQSLGVNSDPQYLVVSCIVDAIPTYSLLQFESVADTGPAPAGLASLIKIFFFQSFFVSNQSGLTEWCLLNLFHASFNCLYHSVMSQTGPY